MSIGNQYESIKNIIADAPEDQFGKDITGGLNPVRTRVIAREGEARAVDKKKSSVLKDVLGKLLKKKAK